MKFNAVAAAAIACIFAAAFPAAAADYDYDESSSPFAFVKVVHDNEMNGDGAKASRTSTLEEQRILRTSNAGGKADKPNPPAPVSVHIAPLTCTNKCVDANGLNDQTMLLEAAIVECNGDEKGQEWSIHRSEGSIVQVESRLFPGMCLAVAHDHYVLDPASKQLEIAAFYQVSKNLGKAQKLQDAAPATPATIQACTAGTVGLISCECPSTRWYFTGGQFISLSCWKAGLSTLLSVGRDPTSRECLTELKSIAGEDGAISKDSTFMIASARSLAVEVVESSSSDARLKHNVALIGNSPSGIPIYTFNYREGMKLADGHLLDTKSTFVGTMAQDLLTLAPDAVIMNTEDGYYRVDYSKIDVDFYKLDVAI